MAKHKVEKTAPKDCRIPKDIPDTPKFKTILADPPWVNQQNGSWGNIIKIRNKTLTKKWVPCFFENLNFFLQKSLTNKQKCAANFVCETKFALVVRSNSNLNYKENKNELHI